MKAPCTSHKIFTAPRRYTNEEIDAACEMCTHCPLIKKCAQLALTSGTNLTKTHPAPATGVIQAGVICRGDKDTIDQLAVIAGGYTPMALRKRSTQIPVRCVGCGEVMVVRNRNESVRGKPPTHSSGGYCRSCDAKRRRQPGWVSENPNYSTIL